MSTDENAENGQEELEGRSSEDVETVATIMVEVRDTAGADVSRDEAEEMIRTRLTKARVELADAEVADLAKQLVEGTD